MIVTILFCLAGVLVLSALLVVMYVLGTTIPAGQVGHRKIEWLLNSELPELPEPFWDPSLGAPDGMSYKAVDGNNPYLDDRWNAYLREPGIGHDEQMRRWREGHDDLKRRGAR